VTTDALAPVRQALLAAAETDSRRWQADGDEAGRHTLDEAVQLATQLRAQARAQGAADATAALADQRARVGQRVRAIVLRAEREHYDEVHAAARAALWRLREDPEYPRLRRRLAETVRRRLGEDADLREPEGGGVIGTTPGRRVDCSLAWFLERAVDCVLAEDRSEGGGESP
jgi:hypothetical protein